MTRNWMYLILLAVLLSCFACSPKVVGARPESQEVIEPTVESRAIDPGANENSSDMDAGRESAASTSPDKDAQGILDESLAFCQASQDFWGKGELENAISALDQAYELILKADTEDNAALDQQKEDIRLTICKRMLEIHTSRHTAVNGNHKAIPLDLNTEVQREIETFQGPQRNFFLASYRRSGRYREEIQAALVKEGLPADLAWLPLIESGFKLRALSSARALGLWQFIPTTGYRFGLKRDEWVDERMNVEKSTRAAIAYLRELHRIFGDWTTALAAYNCGETRVLRVIRSQNVNYLDNFWDLYAKLPEETRRYVPRFLAVLHILRDPEKFGFTLKEPDSPVATKTVPLTRQLALQQVARTIAVPALELEALNPELRHKVTPPGGYVLTVPEGKAEALMASLGKVPAYTPPARRFTTHVIQSGETLSHLAKRYRTGIEGITRANKIKKTTLLHIGQKLRIPVSTRAKKNKTRTVKSQVETLKAVRYKVRKGDSLWEVARRHETDVDEIIRLNKLKGTSLKVGQELLIHPDRPRSRVLANTRKYKVQAGDSPYTIARKHTMKLERFLRINRLSPKSRIFPGQDLLVDDK